MDFGIYGVEWEPVKKRDNCRPTKKLFIGDNYRFMECQPVKHRLMQFIKFFSLM